MEAKWIRPLFRIAALYDVILGLAFLVAHRPIFNALGIGLPNHDAYAQFPGAVVLVFGIGFWLVGRDPVRNRDLMFLGILFKLGYALPVFGHLIFGSIPWFWTIFAAADLVFAVLFAAAWRMTVRGLAAPTPSAA